MWFKACTSYGGKKDLNGNWVFSFTAMPREALGEGEYWEEQENGSFSLTKIDRATGEKRYVISNTHRKQITLFEASIDSDSLEVSVNINRDFNEIDGGALLPFRRKELKN